MNAYFVYGIYAQGDVLIYAGVTANPKGRWLHHRCCKNSGKAYEWTKMTGEKNLLFIIIGIYTNVDEAMAAEESIIRSVRPKLNRLIPPLIDPRTGEPWRMREKINPGRIKNSWHY